MVQFNDRQHVCLSVRPSHTGNACKVMTVRSCRYPICLVPSTSSPPWSIIIQCFTQLRSITRCISNISNYNILQRFSMIQTVDSFTAFTAAHCFTLYFLNAAGLHQCHQIWLSCRRFGNAHRLFLSKAVITTRPNATGWVESDLALWSNPATHLNSTDPVVTSFVILNIWLCVHPVELSRVIVMITVPNPTQHSWTK